MSLVTETGLPSLGQGFPFMRTQNFRGPKGTR
jgi:hypothetical protein